MDLTTTARAAARYHGDDRDVAAALQTDLERLIARYSLEFARFLNREPEAIERTEVFDVEFETTRFPLAGYPVSSISSVKSASDRDFAGATAIDSDAYVADASGLLTIDRAGISRGAQTLQVVYTGGMAANTTAFIAAFPDIADAMDDQINEHLLRRNRLGSQSVSAGDGSKSFTGPMRLLPIVKDTLMRHRRIPLG